MNFDNNCSDRNVDSQSIEIKINTNREKPIHQSEFSKYIDEKINANKKNKEKHAKFNLINDFHKKKKKKKKKFTPYEKYNPDNMLKGNEIKIYSNKLKIMKTMNYDISINSSEKETTNINDELINFFIILMNI